MLKGMGELTLATLCSWVAGSGTTSRATHAQPAHSGQAEEGWADSGTGSGGQLAVGGRAVQAAIGTLQALQVRVPGLHSCMVAGPGGIASRDVAVPCDSFGRACEVKRFDADQILFA